MTLVQNLLQPLSGNKIYVIFIAIAILLSGCDPTKKAAKTPTQEVGELDEIMASRKYDRRTGTYTYDNVSKEKVDTINWKSDRNQTPPITSDVKEEEPVDVPTTNLLPETEFKPTYSVALVLPFIAQNVSTHSTSLSKKSQAAIEFYSGAKMAIPQLEGYGVSLDLNIIDAKSRDGGVQHLLSNSQFTNADLVIGPMRSKNIRALAGYFEGSNTTFVSPVFPSDGILNTNPNHVQVSPSKETHYEAILKHARRNNNIKNIVIAGSLKKKSRIHTLQRMHFKLEGSMKADSLTELYVDEMDPKYNELDLTDYIIEGERTVFIIPAYLSSEETFAYSLLRLIDLAKGENEVVVYGMPNWQSFKNVNLDYFEKLQLHITSNYFIDPYDSSYKNFRRRYFETYGTVPSETAIKGYDILLFFGRMLKKHGTKFQFRLDRENYKSIHTEFRFNKILSEKDIEKERFDRPLRFENTYLNVLAFKEAYFQKVN